MKVAFVGKGGSGKTTLAALFSRYLASKNLPVLAIDADINQHMALALGASANMAASMPPLGLEINRVKDYLRGTNPRIHSANAMAKTTPPGTGSNLLVLTGTNPIYDHFARNLGGVRFMATGPFSKEDLGIKCYHSKVGAVELILNHLIDTEHEYVVVDMTAGADSFASGMFTKFDVTFLVVEPTLKSVSVYEQYKQHATGYGVKLAVIGNKVENQDDEDFLRQYVGTEQVASFGRSGYVQKMEKGFFNGLDQLEPVNWNALGQLQSTVDQTQKDWPKFYRQSAEFHLKNAVSWASASAGEDLRQQIDPDFNLDPEVIAR